MPPADTAGLLDAVSDAPQQLRDLRRRCSEDPVRYRAAMRSQPCRTLPAHAVQGAVVSGVVLDEVVMPGAFSSCAVIATIGRNSVCVSTDDAYTLRQEQSCVSVRGKAVALSLLLLFLSIIATLSSADGWRLLWSPWDCQLSLPQQQCSVQRSLLPQLGCTAAAVCHFPRVA